MTTARRTAAVLTHDQRRALSAALHEQRRFRVDQLAELDPLPADEITDQLRLGARYALAQIEAALARMRSGRYGACTRCADHIPLERLEILPMAPLCVRCQREHPGEQDRRT